VTIPASRISARCCADALPAFAYGASICLESAARISDRFRLEERKQRLTALLSLANDERLKVSESFDDGEKLLEAAGRLNLEGIVSKKRSAPYVAGTNCGWVKVKTQTWRQANRERYKMFEKTR
jgi:hypothetical protein